MLIFLVLLAGCSRTRYRRKADADTYALLREKVAESAWNLPSDFDVQPRPDSRLFDPTFIDDPLLPDPSPHLYAYTLPQLPERDSGRFSTGGAFMPSGTNPSQWHVASTLSLPGIDTFSQTRGVTLASHQETRRPPPRHVAHRWVNQPPQPMPAGSLPSPMNSSTDRESYTIDEQSGAGIGLVLLPIPKEAWEAIPAKCRTRMLEFESVLVEYRRTYERGPEPGELDQSPRFALEDIIDTAQLDSREYQSQKETLYSVAMRLSLERFDYDLKFSTGGNRTATNYSHARDAGVTVNGLGIPTSVQADKMLATSADLLARFSNGVVMTFNGPSGFAADVGSDLLLDISQTVFQRDGRFERLTQSERDVIYAARGFHRFRKTFFSDLTSQYYTLLRNYRGIEIESQNYFTLVREFQQRSEEQQQGFAPLLEVDQLEQNVLNARRTLVSDCNNQERALDALKIRIGLPTETPINLNLTELEGLTLRDKLAVTGELIGRVRGRIAAERSNQEPSRVQLVSSNIALLDRILEFYSQQRDLGISAPDSGPLELQRLRLRTDVARMEVEEDRHLVQAERDADEPNITVMLQRSRDLIEGLSHLQGRQLEYAAKKLPGTSFIEQENRSDELQQQVTLLDQTVSDIFDSVELAQLRLLVDRVAGLLTQFEQFSIQLDDLSGLARAPLTPAEALQATINETSQLVQLVDEVRAGAGGGLIPIEMELDDAMLTGLVKRLDLITERNLVADRWRQIKLAADELKSVLNLNASQTISTRADVNRAFDFTFDESRTSVLATLDLPFNRRAQRNAFRQRLIDYQAALRSQMQLEDNIKFDIRDDLRSLALDKERYTIDVAAAALAYERVVTTELQLRLSVDNVKSRDFLEAQNRYTASLSSVASDHIGYIVNRMQLFLDLELLEVDDSGFWTELYDEHYQPEGYYQLPPEAMPAYGTLPHGLMFSKMMRRMLDVPVGVATVHGPSEELESIPAEPNAIDEPDSGDASPLVPPPPATERLLPPPPVDVLE